MQDGEQGGVREKIHHLRPKKVLLQGLRNSQILPPTAKIVVAVLGTTFLQFLAALAILHLDNFEE